MTWYVYLLRCVDDTLYCGISTDLDRRLDQHNGLLAGGARYTKGRRPVALLMSVACPDQSTALRLEAKVKKVPCARKAKVLAAFSTALTAEFTDEE